MTAIERAGTLVVLQVPGVADLVEVVSGDVDFVRPRVIDFAAQAPAVLHAESGLESVVVAVGGVFLLGDVAPALVSTERRSSAVREPDGAGRIRIGAIRCQSLYLLLPSPALQRMFMSVFDGKLLKWRWMF